MTLPTWLWIPITLWAAFAQSLRNAAQRHLTRELGTLGATSVRFLYGLPFALAWLLLVKQFTAAAWPNLPITFVGWVAIASVAQIAGTALLLRVMTERNFALGVAYSKTEAVQVAMIAVVFLGDTLAAWVWVAITVATLGVVLFSTGHDAHPVRAMLQGWTTRSAWIGLSAGAAFALSAVGFRGATLSLTHTHYLLAAAVTLVVAQCLQSVLLSIWLRLRERGTLTRVLHAWRGSLLAGFMGAAATAGWFTAMAIEPIAHVRTLGLIELVFSLVISRRVFHERLRKIEWFGMLLLMLGLAAVTLLSVT
jgi:drug/metabolite transporter (DMT)-like permease